MSGAQRNVWKHLAGRLFLKAMGWKLEGTEVPEGVNKAVVLAAPHTSSWDLPLMLAVSAATGIDLSWFGRKGLFEGPFGEFLSWTGGIPIDRDARHGVVGQIVEAFEREERLFILIAPEGRLERTDFWKSGFYHIAHQANIPLGLSFLDYGRKVGGLGPLVYLTGDMTADMDKLRAFYKDITPKNPALYGPIVLKEEAAMASEDARVAVG